MPIYDMYPYTNLHELNLDALIKLYKDFKAEIDGWEALFHGLETCFTFDDDNEIVNCAYEIIAPMGLRGNADSADRLNMSYSVGSSTLPVYFNNGSPIACGSQLAVDITGHAATATTATNATSAARLAAGKTINLTGDVTGSVTTNFSGPTVNIATTVVNGGGGSEEKVIIDAASVTTEEDPNDPGTCYGAVPFIRDIDLNRLYTVIIDSTEYNHVYSRPDNAGFATIGDGSATWPFEINVDIGIITSSEDTFSLKVIEEDYDCYFSNELNYNSFSQYGDAWGCNDPAYQVPLALLEGDYIIWWNDTKYEGHSTIAKQNSDTLAYLGDENLSDYPFFIYDDFSHNNAFRVYTYIVNSQPLANLPVKIFGPKQTGKIRTVTCKMVQPESWTLTGGLGVGIISLETDLLHAYSSDEYQFYFNGKKFINCSVPNTSSINLYEDRIGSPGGLTLEISSHARSSVASTGFEDITLWYYNIDYRVGFEMDILE